MVVGQSNIARLVVGRGTSAIAPRRTRVRIDDKRALDIDADGARPDYGVVDFLGARHCPGSGADIGAGQDCRLGGVVFAVDGVVEGVVVVFGSGIIYGRASMIRRGAHARSLFGSVRGRPARGGPDGRKEVGWLGTAQVMNLGRVQELCS